MPREGYRVLVADDDELVRRLIHTILAQQGYEVGLCEDGDVTLKRLAEVGWSLLIVDLHMPHRSGLEVIRELRANGSSLPVILISAMLSEEVVEECGSLGPVECIPKPFSVERLRAAVARFNP
jgi:CheY-like chemotaxis protein